MEEGKIYNVCLERLKFQVRNAKARFMDGADCPGRVILESYNTADIEEIVDILEIYDLEERTITGLAEKLDELAYTVSTLVRERIAFDYDGKGNLGIYLLMGKKGEAESAEAGVAAASARM